MEETRNSKGYIVNAQGRECSLCRVFKLWDFFSEQKEGTKGRHSRCKECKAKASKKLREKMRNCAKRNELFENTERKYKSGEERADGMVFSGYNIYAPVENNFEVWSTKKAHNKRKKRAKKNREDRAERFSKIERKYKRGYVREDDLKCWRYSCTYESTNFEKWVTEDEFENRKFNETKRVYMSNSLGKFGGKDEPTDEIIGLNDHDLSCYIESLFEDGMTWKNRGSWEGKWNPKKPKWHLDHIIPLDAANTLEEAKMLWHYTNLRPIWGNENLAKSNKHCKKELAAFLKKRKASK